MGQRVVRVGETCNITCSIHGATTATFNVGSPSVFAQGAAVVRIGDSGVAVCGHFVKATVGSTKVFANSIGVHRVNDTGTIHVGSIVNPVVGSYTILSSTTNVFAD